MEKELDKEPEKEKEIKIEKSAKKDKYFTISFNENRSFELFIGRKCFFFYPYSIETLTEEEINHPDFIQQAGYFNIKEN